MAVLGIMACLYLRNLKFVTYSRRPELDICDADPHWIPPDYRAVNSDSALSKRSLTPLPYTKRMPWQNPISESRNISILTTSERGAEEK
jgi:hypothetical protein